MTDDRASQLHSLSIDRGADSSGSGGPGWIVLIIMVLVAAALGAAGGYFLTGQRTPAPTPVAAAPADASAPAPAATESAAPRPAAVRGSGLVASGYVVARRQATVSAEITGLIAEVLIEEGAVVEAGQVLARLNDERARIDLTLIEANLQSAEARVRSLTAQRDEARVQLSRAERLVASGYSTEAAISALTAQADALDAQIASARADVAAARARVTSQLDYIDRHVIRSPFAGVVIAKNAQVGEILSPASAGGGFTRTGIATLVDMASLELEVDVNEGQIQRVRAGQPVEAVLDAYPDWRIPARVEAIIPTADRARATIQVRVALNERDARVLPDMAARVTFLDE